MADPTLIVPARYNGPEGSGNGGFTCGLIARRRGDGTATVTLRRPPPLQTPLSVVRERESVKVYDGDTLVAEAEPAAPLVESPASGGAVPPVGWDDAAAAARSYEGFAAHPFPTCYVCGPRRPAGDGLRIFPGRLGDGRVAAPFTAPDEVAGSADTAAAVVWAALDCPGGWAVISPGRPYVLGRMTATALDTAALRPADRCVVVGACVSSAGRKAEVVSSLYGPTGDLLATARAIWLALPG